MMDLHGMLEFDRISSFKILVCHFIPNHFILFSPLSQLFEIISLISKLIQLMSVRKRYQTTHFTLL